MGTSKRGNEAPKEEPSKRAKTILPAGGANAELAACFKELSDYEFKQKATFKGIAYKKVAQTLSQMDPIRSVLQVKGIKGIGKQSYAKIDEYLDTGRIERLEKYRRGEMDGDD